MQIKIISSLLFFIPFVVNASDLGLLFNELDRVIDSSVYFNQEKELKIKGLKEMLAEDIPIEQEYHIVNSLINEYEKYTFDSTMLYIERSIMISESINNQNYIHESNIKLARILTLSGRYKESIDVLESIDEEKLNHDNLKFYLETYWKTYGELSFYSKVSKTQLHYKQLYNNYTDSLLKYLNPESDQYLSIIETRYRDNRQLDDCEKINEKRFNKAKVGTKIYSLIAFERSLLYELKGDVENQKKFLILSAISDIRASVKDNASLTTLAKMLYNEGDIYKSHDYINFSFKDAEFYNSRLRFIGISNILPLITEAYEDSVNKQKTKLRNSLIVISILSILLLLTVIYIYTQVKKLARARNMLKTSNENLAQLNNEIKANNELLNSLNSQLSESNHVKEQYIGSFLGIWSNFIDKLNSYRKMVNKQIEDRKVAELHQITKSRKLIDDELNEFYENFDSTFLSIYPNFVEEFNKLLENGEQISIKQGELLNTELRIFALIRLGINDSTKIAGLLRYSVRTIYNYRVKIKNKAVVPRDDFEDYILRIGAFQN